MSNIMNNDDIFVEGNLQSHFQNLPHDSMLLESDWSYTMRREMQEIVPGIFLGPYAAATKKMLPNLQENNITHVVCVRHPMEAKTVKPNFPELLQYLVIDLSDISSECILPIFPKVKAFIDRCLECGGKALIHGNAGISSSATLAIAYVMETYGLKFDEAFQFVQRRRFCVNPTETFKRQLIEYEALYLARQQADYTQRSDGLKRSIDELGEEQHIENQSKKSS